MLSQSSAFNPITAQLTGQEEVQDLWSSIRPSWNGINIPICSFTVHSILRCLARRILVVYFKDFAPSFQKEPAQADVHLVLRESVVFLL